MRQLMTRNRWARPRRDEHGDVPGWVMITMMTLTSCHGYGAGV